MLPKKQTNEDTQQTEYVLNTRQLVMGIMTVVGAFIGGGGIGVVGGARNAEDIAPSDCSAIVTSIEQLSAEIQGMQGELARHVDMSMMMWFGKGFLPGPGVPPVVVDEH